MSRVREKMAVNLPPMLNTKEGKLLAVEVGWVVLSGWRWRGLRVRRPRRRTLAHMTPGPSLRRPPRSKANPRPCLHTK